MRVLGPGARPGPRFVTEGRAFELIVLPPDAANAATALQRLQGIAGVEFAAPVFYHQPARMRLVPTDELILKLKPATTKADLDRLLVARGLTVVRPMVGSSEEYVVRAAGETVRDPLAESRTLYETGRFEWVEPNFVHEIQKQQNDR